MTKIQFGGRRSVEEWWGATPDSRPPRLVQLRIFERCGGICHIAKRKIRAGEPWDVDHVQALRDGGENRESNMAPALRDKHRKKTGAENSERAQINETKAGHIGIKKPTRKIRGWRRFDGTPVHADRGR